MDKRESNARMLDPDRFKIAKDMSYMPGGPMMNNPMNVTNMSPQLGSMDGVNQYPYGDSGVEMDSRMGAVGPSANSGMPQNYGAWYWLQWSAAIQHSAATFRGSTRAYGRVCVLVKMQ
jgi:maltose-binding protein MalE